MLGDLDKINIEEGGVQHTINLKICYMFGALDIINTEEGGATHRRGEKCVARLDFWTKET